MLKENTPLSINIRRRHDNIKINLKETMSGGRGLNPSGTGQGPAADRANRKLGFHTWW